MERLIEILEELEPDVDYETTENLIDGRYLDSLKILYAVLWASFLPLDIILNKSNVFFTFKWFESISPSSLI